MAEFCIFFAVQFIQYLVITVNMRAVAAGKYTWTAITDALVAGLGFFLIQHVASSHSKYAWAGYVIGGLIGSQGGIWISKRLWTNEAH